MPYSIKYDAELDCIRVRMDGIVDMTLVNNCAADLARFVEKHDCARYLSDIREATIDLSTTDIFTIPLLASKTGLNYRFKRAIVVKALDPDFLFYETVSRNRGQQVHIFTDIDEARSWLRE